MLIVTSPPLPLSDMRYPILPDIGKHVTHLVTLDTTLVLHRHTAFLHVTELELCKLQLGHRTASSLFTPVVDQIIEGDKER